MGYNVMSLVLISLVALINIFLFKKVKILAIRVFPAMG